MQTKTKKRLSYKGKVLARTASSYGGAYKLLKLLSKTQGTEKVSSVVASNDGLVLLQHFKGNF